MPALTRRVRTYGLWAITAPRGHLDWRVFLENRKGDWPVSVFQRAIGVRLHPPTTYRRSFARMGDWKGFFLTHARRSPQKRLQALLRKACEDLGESRTRAKPVANAKDLLAGATGHAVVWTKRIRFVFNPPRGRLLARLYVRSRPLGDA
jgi:hypothetical protein